MFWGELNATDLAGRVAALNLPSSPTIVDFGCGKNDGPISNQVRGIKCSCLISVDAWPANIFTVRGSQFKAEQHDIIQGTVQDVLRNLIKDGLKLDIALCLDIVEHMPKEEARRWVMELDEVFDNILIWIPLGPAKMDHDWWGDSNHELQSHKSEWQAEELNSLGYTVEVFPDFHTAMFAHLGLRVDAAWAVKRNEV